MGKHQSGELFYLVTALVIMACTSVHPCAYLDKGLPFVQESWATIGAQVRLLFSINKEIRAKCVQSRNTWLVMDVAECRRWHEPYKTGKTVHVRVHIKQNIRRGNVSADYGPDWTKKNVPRRSCTYSYTFTRASQ